MDLTKIELKENEVWVRDNILSLPDSPSGVPNLIAGKCKECGDVSFPKKERCGICSCKEVGKIFLSRRARVLSYTIVHRTVPGYKLPNIVAMLKFPEDDSLMVISQLKNVSPDEVKSGMDVELITDHLYDSFLSGQRVFGYAFQPVKGGN